jgi:hypothetical protein
MFMRLQGGGIGHKATWEWNDIMLSDAGKAVDDEIEEGAEEMGEAGTNESGGGEVSEEPPAAQEDAEEDDWEGLDLGGELGGDEDEHPETWTLILPDAKDSDEENEGGESDKSDNSEEEDPHRVIPDDGEELDDDIYADEGYSTL